MTQLHRVQPMLMLTSGDLCPLYQTHVTGGLHIIALLSVNCAINFAENTDRAIPLIRVRIFYL